MNQGTRFCPYCEEFLPLDDFGHNAAMKDARQKKCRVCSQIYTYQNCAKYWGLTSMTAAQWRALCKEYDHKCAACGKAEFLTVDHIEPYHAGSKFKGGFDLDNVQPLCLRCNSKKGQRIIDYRLAKRAGVSLEAKADAD
jgi:5-methylcytosine-specific restriction endonuclease McrA